LRPFRPNLYYLGEQCLFTESVCPNNGYLLNNDYLFAGSPASAVDDALLTALLERRENHDNHGIQSQGFSVLFRTLSHNAAGEVAMSPKRSLAGNPILQSRDRCFLG
jgi:hypothetical protein